MKYAHEILGLMYPYSGKEYRMAQLMREASRERSLSQREKETVRKGVRRVLDHLTDSGQVERIGGEANSVTYGWRGWGHEVCQNAGLLGRSLGQYVRAPAP